MGKIDKVLLFVLATVIGVIIFKVVTKNLVASVFIALLISTTVTIILIHVINRRKNKKVITVTEMENEFALLGSGQIEYLTSTIPEKFSPIKKDNGFIYDKDGNKVYVACNYKFSTTSFDDVAKFYRQAKEYGVSQVYVCGKQPTRNVILFASELDVLFRFLPSKKLHAYLLNQNKLPTKRKVIRPRRKLSLKNNISSIFNKKRAKHFAISGLVLGITAIFTPFTVYYVVFCSICLILSIICLLTKT